MMIVGHFCSHSGPALRGRRRRRRIKLARFEGRIVEQLPFGAGNGLHPAIWTFLPPRHASWKMEIAEIREIGRAHV